MGAVYAAENLNTGRRVAVKVLHGEWTRHSSVVQRFLREARATTSIAHPNVVEVLDLDVDQDNGTPYIVQEFLEGETVEAHLASQPHERVDPAEALTILMPVMSAIVAAHERGIVHRDLKPANLFLSRARGGEIVPKVIDFGIAKNIDRAAEATSHTQAGAAIGTPAYMSPEQVLGDQMDFRSDIFSFGIVLYEALTGRRPFEEDPARTVMQKIRLDRYVSPRRLRPDVPTTLERILSRCLEKNPAYRYPSTGSLCDDLNEHLARRGLISHEARLVGYLRERGVVDDREMRDALGPMAAEWSKAPPKYHPMREVVAGQAASVFVALAALATLDAARGREQDPTTWIGPRPPGAPGTGQLRVLARPWAEVLVDGTVVDTTPMSRAIALAPGQHFVRLRNPAFITEDRAVQVTAGETVWIDVDLRAAREGASAR